MAIARIASQDNKASGTSGTVTATFPAAPTLGNLIIVTIWKGGGTDPAPGGTWYLDQVDNAGNNTSIRMLQFHKFCDNATTDQSFSYSVGANPSRIHMYEYSGALNDGTSGVRALNEGNSGASTVSSQDTNAVAAIAGDLLFAFAGTATAYTGTGAWTNSFSLLQQDTGLRMFDGERIIAADGSYNSVASWTTTNKATAFITAFKPVPVAVVNPGIWGVPMN